MSNHSDQMIKPDAELHEALLRRYGQIQPDGIWRRLGFHCKRLAWKVVVNTTYVFKRQLDIIVSLGFLILFMPLSLIVMLLIVIESPGPIFFRQIRVGRGGKLFSMWKFRSMYVDAEARKAALLAQNESNGGVIFKMKYDPRITRVGRFIRRASIDELPQLWNVLVGDMSLVGPRPALPSEVKQYSLADRRRLEVTPGITCFWQVSGRSEIPFPEQVKLDVQYIESSSVSQDILILLRTIPAVLSGRGAY